MNAKSIFHSIPVESQRSRDMNYIAHKWSTWLISGVKVINYKYISFIKEENLMWCILCFSASLELHFWVIKPKTNFNYPIRKTDFVLFVCNNNSQVVHIMSTLYNKSVNYYLVFKKFNSFLVTEGLHFL